MMGPNCAPNIVASRAPMPRPARRPPQRPMKLGLAAAAAEPAAAGAGVAPWAGAAWVGWAGAGAASLVALGAARCLPTFPPPPKRRAASASRATRPRIAVNARAIVVRVMGTSFRYPYVTISRHDRPTARAGLPAVSAPAPRAVDRLHQPGQVERGVLGHGRARDGSGGDEPRDEARDALRRARPPAHHRVRAPDRGARSGLAPRFRDPHERQRHRARDAQGARRRGHQDFPRL